MDQVAKHPALAKQMSRRELPPDNHSLDSEEARVEYVKNHISTQYHLIGTAAMGEVVDDRLKVKGVSNLRVVDASIFPGHVSGVSTPIVHIYLTLTEVQNIMSTTYAVGEKGSDMIKEDHGIKAQA